MVRDIGIGLGNHHHNNPLLHHLEPLRQLAYGAVQIKSGIDGEDWGNTPEIEPRRAGRKHHFGGLDAIPVVGAVGKRSKSIQRHGVN